MKVKRLFALMLALVICMTLVSGAVFAYRAPSGSGGSGGSGRPDVIGPPDEIGPGEDAAGRTSVIEVTVFGPLGNPAEGVTVELYKEEEPVATGETDENGVFTFIGIHGFGETRIVATLDLPQGSTLEGEVSFTMKGYDSSYEEVIYLLAPGN